MMNISEGEIDSGTSSGLADAADGTLFYDLLGQTRTSLGNLVSHSDLNLSQPLRQERSRRSTAVPWQARG